MLAVIYSGLTSLTAFISFVHMDVIYNLRPVNENVQYINRIASSREKFFAPFKITMS